MVDVVFLVGWTADKRVLPGHTQWLKLKLWSLSANKDFLYKALN